MCHGTLEVDCYVCIIEMVCYFPYQHSKDADLNPRDDIMYQSLYTM